MRLSPKIYAELWYSAMDGAAGAERDAVAKRFLSMIYGRGHWKWLAEIVRRVRELEQRKTGRVAVSVKTAHKLDANVVRSWVEKLLSNNNITIRQDVDPSLLGGVRVETENTRWDLSLRGKIQALTNTIKEPYV